MISHLCCSARGDLCDFAAHCALCLENLASTEDDEEERGLLLAVRKPVATIDEENVVNIEFQTGPSLGIFDYAVFCVEEFAGCRADPVTNVESGELTREVSTIEATLTGLTGSSTTYDCYISVSTDKVEKCELIRVVTSDAPPPPSGWLDESSDPEQLQLGICGVGWSRGRRALRRRGSQCPRCEQDHDESRWHFMDRAGWSQFPRFASSQGHHLGKATITRTYFWCGQVCRRCLVKPGDCGQEPRRHQLGV